MIILSLQEYKPIIIIGLLISLLIASVYVISLYWPKYEEYFFELALLGRDERAEDYFPDDNSTIQIGTPISWHVYIHNHMGAEEKVVIRVKILNSTMPAPDDREHLPSSEPSFFEIPVSMSVDETVLVPFNWSVVDSEYKNATIIRGLVVNRKSFEVDVSSFSDGVFRIVFELWVYDQELNEYVFGWYSKGEFYSASIYMWFELHLPYVS